VGLHVGRKLVGLVLSPAISLRTSSIATCCGGDASHVCRRRTGVGYWRDLARSLHKFRNPYPTRYVVDGRALKPPGKKLVAETPDRRRPSASDF
jgi:hypothetical protein